MHRVAHPTVGLFNSKAKLAELTGQGCAGFSLPHNLFHVLTSTSSARVREPFDVEDLHEQEQIGNRSFAANHRGWPSDRE
jgi:hypothetical protein